MFLERRTSVKTDLSVFNIRINIKVTGFPLNHDLKEPSSFRLRLER